MTQVKRKGARWLDLGQERWSYYVGKKFVEVRDPNNKATLIPREKIDELVNIYCGKDCGSVGCDHIVDTGMAAKPKAIAAYIKANLRT